MDAENPVTLAPEEALEHIEQGGTVLIGNVRRSYAFSGDVWYAPNLDEPFFDEKVRREDIQEVVSLLGGGPEYQIAEGADWQVTDSISDQATVMEIYDNGSRGLRLEELDRDEAPDNIDLTTRMDFFSLDGPNFYRIGCAELPRGCHGDAEERYVRKVAGELEQELEGTDATAFGYVPPWLKRKISV